MEKVIAITVTYNDFDFLKKALKALRDQTYKVEKIIVVDNCSNKENREKLLLERDECVEILFLDENLGGAGGFEKGMEYTRKKYQPDWYWLMDADAFPENDCLEKLLNYKNAYDNIGILAPLIYGVDLKQYQLYHHKKLAKFLSRDKNKYNDYAEIPEYSMIDADAFVGPLVYKTAVDDLGIADGNLFIYGDDLEYTYRISRKYPVVLIKDAIINHRDQPVNGVQRPNNWWKDYYMFRNRILFINKYGDGIIDKKIGIFLVRLRVLKQLIKLLFSNYNSQLKRIRKKLLLAAIKDGIKGYSGKIIDPKEYNEEINLYVEDK